jgi:chemosensory pili system protein ChpA (sensor histidine kinase/response regulator)
MQNFDTATALSGVDGQANDLGPLAWVLDELRKSLDTATKALRRYVRDAEMARGSDLSTVDEGQLRISRQQLHQAVGALEMVGFTGPAIVLRSMETAVQKFIARPELCTEAAAAKIERASFALTGYLETVLSGKEQTPVTLFEQYAQVQEIAGASRVHPADLWTYPWRWIDVADTGIAPAAINPDTRAQFDRAALMVIKALDATAAGDLARLSASIAMPAGGVVERQFTIFWRIAAGFFEAIATASLTGDVYVKRTVSRILTQLATHGKGDMTVSDRLAQDLLFFCAQSRPMSLAPLLGEVRMSYALASHTPIDYAKSPYGQFDPALLVQARKRITAAKESWSGLTAGDLGKIKGVQDQFSLIVDSITKLLPSGQTLSKALMGVAESAAKSNQAPEPALGMEVATSILYLEAGFEDFDPNDPALKDRVNHLAERVENARNGATNQALEPWMEELYRRVSDRQTMGSVVGELKLSLGELEKSMDQFFRDPQDKAVLVNVPSRLAQMRGVLSVLGLGHASQAVLRMRDSVEQIIVTEIDDVQARAAGTFDKIGNNLGALGFLIDMLSYQPVLAKKLFVFDEEHGELKPLMGRVKAAIPLSENAADIEAGVHVAAAAAVTAATAGVVAAVSAAPAALASGGVAPSAHAAVVEDTLDDDDAELLDIFLEEAREVIGNGQAAVTALASEPSNLAELTTLRRAFHTLKGSSRMVGLNTFGEAGWSLEQMLNGWMADQKAADESLCNTASQALSGMGRWVEDIAAGNAQAWTAAPFRASADALRVHGQFLALQLDGLTAAPAPSVQGLSALPEPALPEITLAPDTAADTNLLTLPLAAAAAVAVALPVAAQPAELAVQEFAAEEFAVAQPAVTEPIAAQPADLDFAFDLSLPQFEVPAPTAPVQMPVVDMAVPDEMQPTSASADAGVDNVAAELDNDFFFDMEEASALTVDDGLSTAELTAPAADVESLDHIELNLDEEAAMSAEELVSADEFAAFERAMMEQDALLAASDAQAVPAAADAQATMIDSASTPLDFGALPTQPMQFKDEAAPAAAAVSDLGFDLGNYGVDTPASSTSLGLGLAGTAALAAGFVAASPAPAAALLQPLGANSGLAALSSEDQYKAIGPLRISLQLYNVYLNEADEWSRRLVTSVTEWSLEPGQPLPNDAVVFAHSLAGSSSTVGFTALSGLARTMEHALQHVQAISEDGVYQAHQHSADFISGAEEIRRLLHQFAAGLLREPMHSVEQALERCLHAPEESTQYHAITATQVDSGFVNLDDYVPEAQPDNTDSAIDFVADIPLGVPSEAAPLQSPVHSGFASLSETVSVTVIAAAAAATVASSVTAAPSAQDTPSVVESLPEVVTESAPVQATAVVVEPVPELKPEPEPESLHELEIVPEPEPAPQPVWSAPAETPAPAAAPAAPAFTAVALGITGAALSVVPRSLTEQEAEDEIDVMDALDPDLFPIFEEEALELFPQLGGALRQWTSRPSNTGARAEVLRGLHTLKGSARLAGALRLGELAHRMETAIEQMPEQDVSSPQLEPLTGLLDGMQANFDRLRHPQEIAAPVEIASPVIAPLTGATTVVDTSTATSPALATLPPLRVVSPGAATALAMPAVRTNTNQTVRVRSQLLDRLVNQAGEVMITRSRLEAELNQLRGSLGDLTGNLDKLRMQLRDIEVQSESQMQSRMALAKENNADFDPLEFDRFTRVQELTRMMAESVNDVATVQRSIQRTVEATEDDLVAQARQTRELQRDLLRTRMVEFEGISERLYRVVRQAGKDAGKQVKLDITGGSIEMDRGVLDRMTPAFEHLLRNCVAHGIESAQARLAAGKDASGQITISLHQEGNDISVEFRDDGAGLNLTRIREQASAQGLLSHGQKVDDSEAANLIFTPGFTTATQVTELSGRGIGMDVVRSEVLALGGRIETSTSAGQGTNFKLVLPLTTAVTQVVMLRIGNLSVGVPANLVETVRRATPKELQSAYNTGTFDVAGEALPFFWSGALLQHSRASDAMPGKTIPVLVFRSAAQRIVAHVDEVLGNQEVVVKNLGPQLSRLPGLAGMSVLASGAVALIYNPVALAAVYGQQARAMSADKAEAHVLADGVTDVVARDLSGDAAPVVPLVPANPLSVSQPHVPLVLVVDDSITVRRVTQRLLQREGYRVALAADGLLALERLAEELPAVVLSDIEMPRMDGFDLVRNIKADPRLAGLPIITITSRIAEKHREHAMALGVNHYLGKPYSEEELLSLIRRYTSVEASV